MSLFDIEISYQKLIKSINTPSTIQFKLKILSDFLSGLIDEKKQINYSSYFTDLLPELFKLINKNELDFIPPEEIEQIEKVINVLEKDLQLETYKSDFKKSKEMLKVNKTKILALLENRITSEIKPSQHTDSVAIVLIEKNDNADNNHIIETGQIHKLHISSSIRQKSEKIDKVEFKNLIDLNETEIIKHLNSVVGIAKEECKKKNIKTNHYNITYYFDKQDYIYSGSSLGIGAICLAYNSILINELQRYYFKFRNDCVFSGEIDKYGNLNKLDDESLKIKLRTVFYSKYNKFIIPEDNLAQIKIVLAKLQKIYPKRELELIPLKNFESVFKNLDIVERYELKFHQKIKANYKKYHITANWFISILAILIIGFFGVNYLIPHLDRNPDKTGYDNDKYTAYNKYGLKVWESEILNKNNYPLVKDKEGLDRRLIISDIDNDGKNNILYILRSDSSSIENRTVYCKNSDNSLKWNYKTPNKTIYYDEKQYTDMFQTLGIYVIDLKNNGNKNIICTGLLCSDFPFSVTKLDSEGNFISEFWNSGFLIYLSFYDVDKQGDIEIEASGCNNKYRRAALVIFDPNYLEGSSPETDPLRNGKNGLEKYYILFPRTILNYYSGKDINFASHLNQFNGEGINVNVLEGGSKNSHEEGYIIYKFNKKLELIEVVISSPWIAYYEELVKDKVIEPINDLKQYSDSLKKSILYWDGDKFVSYPAINKYYIQRKDSLNSRK